MRYLLLLMSLIAFSCTSKKDADDGNGDATDSIAAIDTTVRSDSHFFWSADLLPDGVDMKRERIAGMDSLSVTAIIRMLNVKYPEVQLQLVRQSNDTLFTAIPRSDYLTRQMGTSGPMVYLAEATYNLTEVPGISFVHFELEEGDHAGPGTYARTDFVRKK